MDKSVVYDYFAQRVLNPLDANYILDHEENQPSRGRAK
jgi:hypothetical protein